MCECIGHRPLWGCCPSFSSHATNCAGVMGTADHVMLLRLLRYSWKIVTRPDTQTGISRGGWAGAVKWRAGAVGSAVYTTALVAHDWTGAVMKNLLGKCKKKNKRKSKHGTDQPTDRPTDRPTQWLIVYSRMSCDVNSFIFILALARKIKGKKGARKWKIKDSHLGRFWSCRMSPNCLK